MSSDSLKQCGVSSKTRSISEIIESLSNSFQPSDFKAAVYELMMREEGLRKEKASLIASLREKSDYFERERNELKIEHIQWEEERRRLRREFEVNEDQLKEITRKLSLVEEDKEKAIKRYDGLFKELNDMRVEKDELIQNLVDMTGLHEALKRELREKEDVIDELTREKECRRDAWLEELTEAQRKIEGLEKEKLKFDARIEALMREKEEGVEDMVKRIEFEKRQAEEIRRKNKILEEQKVKSDDVVENLRRCDQEKEVRIKKLMEEIELREREKKEIVKEKDRKIQELEDEKGVLESERRESETKLAQVEESFSKLEEDVINYLGLELRRNKELARSQIGKELSKIIMAPDAKDFDLANDGNIQEADSTLKSHANEPQSGMKLDKQEDVKRKLIFDCNDDTENERTRSVDPIIIDSDDDDDDDDNNDNVKAQRLIGVKSKRSLIEQKDHDGSSDDNLNPKLKHVKCEQVKQELSSASKRDQKVNSPQSQAAMNVREEKLKGEATGPRSCSFSKNNDSKTEGSKSISGTTKSGDYNRKADDLKKGFWQRRLEKRLECEADMLCAIQDDLYLCAKAVCALYRHKKTCVSPVGGSTGFRSLQVLESDLERIRTLANYLTDGAPRGNMKKSIRELEKHDPRAPYECRNLADKYSKLLIDIYRKGEDPFFSPSSTDMQYK